MTASQTVANFERFTALPLRLFAINGISARSGQTLGEKVRFATNLCDNFFVFAQSISFFFLSGTGSGDMSYSITISSYCFMWLGKLVSIMWKRSLFVRTYTELRRLYPSQSVELRHNLQRHLQSYLWAVRIYLGLSMTTSSSVLFPAIFVAFYNLWKFGEHTQDTPLQLWYPQHFKDSLVVYIITYFVEIAMYSLACSVIYAFDLYLYSSILQLCLRFDWLCCQIMELEPQNDDSFEKLKKIAQEHLVTLKILVDIDEIFTPSVIVSLFSSSSIMCFSLFQLLDDLTLEKIVSATLVAGYELIRLGFICYFGDKLMQASAKINEVLYQHNWEDGSLKYRRTVLFMMMNTQRTASLKVSGVTEVSLDAFKEVVSMTYRFFTVLKTAKVQRMQP